MVKLIRCRTEISAIAKSDPEIATKLATWKGRQIELMNNKIREMKENLKGVDNMLAPALAVVAGAALLSVILTNRKEAMGFVIAVLFGCFFAKIKISCDIENIEQTKKRFKDKKFSAYLFYKNRQSNENVSLNRINYQYNKYQKKMGMVTESAGSQREP